MLLKLCWFLMFPVDHKGCVLGWLTNWEKVLSLLLKIQLCVLLRKNVKMALLSTSHSIPQVEVRWFCCIVSPVRQWECKRGMPIGWCGSWFHPEWTQAVSFAVKRGWNWTAHVVTVWEVMKANSSTGQNKLIIDPGDC